MAITTISGGTPVTTPLAIRSTSGIVTGRTSDSEGSGGSGTARGGGGAAVCIDRSCLGGAVYDASVEGPDRAVSPGEAAILPRCKQP